MTRGTASDKSANSTQQRQDTPMDECQQTVTHRLEHDERVLRPTS